MIVEKRTTEFRMRIGGRGRDNHLFDAMVIAGVAGLIEDALLPWRVARIRADRGASSGQGLTYESADCRLTGRTDFGSIEV